MALKATIFKANLQVTDTDRHYYQSHTLILARHPSETDERMMVRLLAFALHAGETLEFSKGLSTPDEPALWSKRFDGEIETWIDVGQPEEKRIRKTCARAREVFVYSYGGRAADLWWKQVHDKLGRFDNLTVINLPEAATAELAGLAQRTMQLQCTIQEGQVWMSSDITVQIEPLVWLKAS
jgi:uncharacterized protein YaeQ